MRQEIPPARSLENLGALSSPPGDDGVARRRWGQVATPRPVADWMTNWACADQPHRILDPAVGEGVFIESVRDFFGQRGLKCPVVHGCEIDADIARRLARRNLPLELRQVDFLRARFASSFDAVIANPPYVRHHSHACDEATLAGLDRLCGERLSRMTNLYGLFLIKIRSLLAPGGRAAVIAPAEWLNADFGVPIKRHLLRENAIEAIVQFSHASAVFSDALTTAAIVLIRGGRRAGDSVRLAMVDDAEGLAKLDLDRATERSPGELDPAQKWSPMIEGRTRPAQSAHTLADIADCSRGIATGANDYFTMSESTRRRWKIDRRDLRLCIVKARQISGDRFTAIDLRALIDADERVYLLSPRDALSIPVNEYLAEGRRLGIPERYLPSHRPVWFRPEVRRPAPILVSVFARGRFRFVDNKAGVLNLTAYHGIYPHDDSPARVGALVDYLNSPAAARSLADHRRIYGGGLMKLEPRDVESLELPDCLYHPCIAQKR